MKRTSVSTAALLPLLMFALSGCGTAHASAQNSSAPPNSSAAHNSQSAKSASPAKHPAWPTVSVSPYASLPVGVVGSALAVAPTGTPVSVGGYTGSVSVTGVSRIDRSSASASPGTVAATVANLPQPTHDAAAGFIGTALYVFGGGQAASYNTVTGIGQGHSFSAGTLPAKLSDAAAVPYTWRGQGGLILLGGYDGQTFNPAARFVSVQSGKVQLQGLFSIPAPLRYTALADAGSTIVWAGGLTPSGGLSRAVYAWSPSAGVHQIATLPQPIQKAAAFSAGSNFVVVAGGLTASGAPTAQVVGIDLGTGKVKILGQLPQPLAYMGYAQAGNTGYLAGGMTTSNESSASKAVLRLRL